MCTVILDIAPGSPVLLAGIRDELMDRPWEGPGRHWPDHPGLVGGRDLQAGGTWLALAPAASRVACVLNGRGRPAPQASRRSRGVLPLEAAEEGKLNVAAVADFDPFHLLIVEEQAALLWSWDGERLAEQELAAGLHIVVNSGSGDDPLAMEHERARVAHFLPRFRAAPRPDPRPGDTVGDAWGAWLPLVDGDGIGPEDPRSLIMRRELDGGRVFGTTSVSLIALPAEGPSGPPAGGPRYDFTGSPGDPGAWYPVHL